MKNTGWLMELILRIKVNSMPYIIKLLIFITVVIIIHLFSDNFVAKALSLLTYTAGISIDAYFINKQISTDSRKLEVFLFFHMLVICLGTFVLVPVMVKAAMTQDFSSAPSYLIYDRAVNIFMIYATITPLLEAIINANGKQLIDKKEVTK